MFATDSFLISSAWNSSSVSCKPTIHMIVLYQIAQFWFCCLNLSYYHKYVRIHNICKIIYCIFSPYKCIVCCTSHCVFPHLCVVCVLCTIRAHHWSGHWRRWQIRKGKVQKLNRRSCEWCISIKYVPLVVFITPLVPAGLVFINGLLHFSVQYIRTSCIFTSIQRATPIWWYRVPVVFHWYTFCWFCKMGEDVCQLPLCKVFVKVVVLNCGSNCEFESYRSIPL